ncbi:MAG: hypothetical protein ABIG37_03100 [Nanoarchaeota archaeon]
MKARIKHNKKIIEIKDIIECKGFQKIKGMMFKKAENANALLFKFKKPNKSPIHSFFCPIFLAIWLREKEMVEFKIIKSFTLRIKPKKDFDMLLEIPWNKKYCNIIKDFYDDKINENI